MNLEQISFKNRNVVDEEVHWVYHLQMCFAIVFVGGRIENREHCLRRLRYNELKKYIEI